MPVAIVVVLAAIQGFAEGMPLSATAHRFLARTLLLAGPETTEHGAAPLVTVACAGSVVAIVLLLWTRLRSSSQQNERARRELGVIAAGAAVSLVTGELVVVVSRAWATTTAAVGVGLLMSACAIASLAICPTGKDELPSVRGALLAGFLHGLAVLPGASRVGAGLFAAMWLGVRPRRALELSLAWTAPALLASAVRDVARNGLEVDAGIALLALAVATLATTAGALAARALVDRRRLAFLALWIAPLGLATLAYGRAVTPV